MATIIDIFKNPDACPDDFADKRRVMRDSILEYMGTTLFVFFGTAAIGSSGSILVQDGKADQHDVAKLMPIGFAFGISIMVMVYSLGHLTGGHFNPGVSLLMYLRRQISFLKMVCYWVSQLLGAMTGSALMWGSLTSVTPYEYDDGTVVDHPPFLLGATTLNAILNQGNGYLLEVMGSFFFYLVIAQTALDPRGVANSFFPPLAIGFSLVVCHIGLIPWTGCGLNPARTFGPSMIDCMAGYCSYVVGRWYWIYWIGPFTASFLVAEVTHMIKGEGDDSQDQK